MGGDGKKKFDLIETLCVFQPRLSLSLSLSFSFSTSTTSARTPPPLDLEETDN